MPETFSPATWADGSAGGTPITAAQLNRIENGIESMDDRVAVLEELNPLPGSSVVAKGDLLVGTGAGAVVRVPVGADATVLTANSGTTSGVAWVDPNAGAGTVPTISTRTLTGTSYTLVLADGGGVVEMNNAAANTVTVPPNSAVAFPIGAYVGLRQYGAGQTSVLPGSAVTIVSPNGALKLSGRYAQATLTKRGTNEWVLSGDIST